MTITHDNLAQFVTYMIDGYTEMQDVADIASIKAGKRPSNRRVQAALTAHTEAEDWMAMTIETLCLMAAHVGYTKIACEIRAADIADTWERHLLTEVSKRVN